MRFTLPTLTRGTAMCAVIDVWIRHLYKNSSTTEFRTDVTALENEILNLPIAREHKQELFKFLRPEVEYLDHWLENFQMSTKDRDDSVSQWLNKINLPKNIRANILGNVDGQATAREILKSGKLSDRDFFRLACFSCLEEEALLTWPLVKSYFIHRVYSVKDYGESSCVTVFTRRFNEVDGNGCTKDIEPFAVSCHDDAADTWYEFGLTSAMKAGNAAALDYFFKQIHPLKRGTLAERIIKYIIVGYGPHNATMISLVIFHMGPQYWYEFCRKCARCIFQICVKRPTWFFFSEMFLEVRNFLKARELLDVLHELAKRVPPLQCELAFEVPLGYHHNDQVASIFDAIWTNTSSGQKAYITHLMLVGDCSDPLFQKLLKMKESLFVRLVNDLFEDSASLSAFLRDGYKSNILCLRTFLYKAFPMRGDDEKVRSMLSLYERGSRMQIDHSARNAIGEVLMMDIEK